MIRDIIEKIENKEYRELEKLLSKDSFTIERFRSKFTIHYKKNPIINLSERNLQDLSNYEMPKINGLTYYKECGILTTNYAEIYLSLINKDYLSISGYFDWTGENLIFGIDSKIIELSYASPLFILLTEPLFSNSDFLDNFENFLTLKILNTNKKEIEDDISKALYYINSHYLRKARFAVKINTFEIEDYYFTEDELSERSDNLNKKRIRIRKNFDNTEPLKLYNYAIFQADEMGFISFYRVLEFFMRRAVLKELDNKRYDEDISTEVLYKSLVKNETDKIEIIISDSCTKAELDQLIKYAESNKLI